MSEPLLTDEQLIELLTQRAPADWSPSELARLSERWPQSPELRAALAEHLQLETALMAQLGSRPVALSSILARADLQQSRTRTRWLTGLFALVVLVAACGGLMWSLGANRSRTESRELAGQQPAVTAPASEAVSAVPPTELATRQPDSTPPSPDAIPETTPDGDQTMPPAEAVPAGLPPGPWLDALAPSAPVWPVDHPGWTMADMLVPGHDQLSELTAREWLQSIEGVNLQWQQEVLADRRVTRMAGRAQLRIPLDQQRVLRLSPFDAEQLALTAWDGDQGVQLRLHTRREPYLWSASRVQRSGVEAKQLALLTTDGGRWFRSGQGRLELRLQAGQLILSRGTVPLLVMPYAAKSIAGLELEGQFRLRGISVVKAEPWELAPETDSTTVLASDRPAALPWQLSAIYRAEVQANGPDVVFTSSAADREGRVFLPFSEPGFHQFEFQLGDCDAGTGLYLGNAAGEATQRIGVVMERRTQRPALVPLRLGEQKTEDEFDTAQQPVPLLQAGQWIRIVSGWGHWQVLVSADGEHWGQLFDTPIRENVTAIASFGMYGLAGPSPRTLRLRGMRVRRLTGFDSLVPVSRLALAPQFAAEELRGDMAWRQRVLTSWPAGVELVDWMNACALAALQQGAQPDTQAWLQDRLLDGLLRRCSDVPERLGVLASAGQLVDLTDERRAVLFARHYAETGRLAIMQSARGDAEHLIRRAWITRFPWTTSALRGVLEPWESASLLQRVERRDWPAVTRQAMSVRFWEYRAHPDDRPPAPVERLEKLARWAAGLAGEARVAAGGLAGTLPLDWRPPLVPTIDKEGYNLRAELSGALMGQQFDDAARILIASNPQGLSGLLPDSRDDRLSLSLSAAMATAIDDYPSFRATLRDRFEKAGELRVAQAIREASVASMEATSLQFEGTVPAARARQWLGDRALSDGHWNEARRHYRRGAVAAADDSGLQTTLASRERLAAALAGDDIPANTIDFTALSLPTAAPLAKDDLGDLLASAASRSLQQSAQGAIPARRNLPIGLYRVEPLATYQGQSGQNAARGEFRGIDAVGRQLATALSGTLLVTSNRFQVNAYEWPAATPRWKYELGAEQGDTHDWSGVPFQPVIIQGNVLARVLRKEGPELVCLAADSGAVKWKWSVPTGRGVVASDPLPWTDGVGVVVADTEDDLRTWSWQRLDLATGRVVATQALLSGPGSFNLRPIAHLATARGVVVATVPGGVFGFVPESELNWVRRDLWVPPPLDPQQYDQRASCLLTGSVDDVPQVVVSPPGSRVVELLNVESGRAEWTWRDVELLGIVGADAQRIFAVTTRDLVALDRETGRELWRDDAGGSGDRSNDDPERLPQRMEAFVAGDRYCVTARRQGFADTSSIMILGWRDVTTGQLVAEQPLGELGAEYRSLGPMLTIDDAVYTFAGKPGQYGERTLFRLIATTPADTSWDAAKSLSIASIPGWAAWAHDELPQAASLQRIHPGASPWTGEPVRPLPLNPEPGSLQTAAVAINCGPQGASLAWTRPATESTVMQWQVRSPAGQPVRVQLRRRGEIVYEQVAQPGDATAWTSCDVALPAVADHPAETLVLTLIPANGTPGEFELRPVQERGVPATAAVRGSRLSH